MNQKILLFLLCLFLSTYQFACLPPEPPKGAGKCIYKCKTGKVLEEMIPKEAKDFCNLKGYEPCECKNLLEFFETNMRHISYHEVLAIMEQKCNE